MSRRARRVEAVTPSGEMFHMERSEAYQFVRDGAASWADLSYDRIQINQKGALRLRGLSCRVGEPLTVAVRQKEWWAQLMLSQITGRLIEA